MGEVLKVPLGGSRCSSRFVCMRRSFADSHPIDEGGKQFIYLMVTDAVTFKVRKSKTTRQAQ